MAWPTRCRPVEFSRRQQQQQRQHKVSMGGFSLVYIFSVQFVMIIIGLLSASVVHRSFAKSSAKVVHLSNSTPARDLNVVAQLGARLDSVGGLESDGVEAKEVEEEEEDETGRDYTTKSRESQAQVERRVFVEQLLKALHQQYAGENMRMDERQSGPGQLGFGPRMMQQLLEAIGADGDVRRLADWLRKSFNPASIPEITTQFVVSKLASINCPALLKPDGEETLMPRFLLFNEHYVDVPYELGVGPSSSECTTSAKFDPRRKTAILIHGYLAGYTLVDGLTNIKNRLLDSNRVGSEQALSAFIKAGHTNGSYVFTEDLDAKIRSQLYNVIIVDWFNGANPTPRSDYIRAAVNAQVVGRLIARFLSALVVQCGTPASHLHIVAHSLGCHVSGFTGKTMQAAGHKLGQITHLDPVGLCFGRLFSQPRFRLSPNDALETQAVHTSLNIFDNPLDGAHSNFLVNGGRDQLGCGGQSELKNSTSSSVSLLFDPGARFAPCSHLRALALLEDDHTSGESSGQCQYVGYRCANYDRFLAGKCGRCDAANSQCRLMGLSPLSMQFRTLQLAEGARHSPANYHYSTSQLSDLHAYGSSAITTSVPHVNPTASSPALPPLPPTAMHSISITQLGPSSKTTTIAEVASTTSASVTTTTKMFGAPYYPMADNELKRRTDRRLSADSKERIAQAIERLRAETRTVIADGWNSLRTGAVVGEILDNHLVAERDIGTTESYERKSLLPSTTSSLFVHPTRTTAQTMLLTSSAESEPRVLEEHVDQIPLGGQATPVGSLNGPLYFLGTGAVSPYCVNYYQFRLLIAESRLARVMQAAGLASNKLAPHYNSQRLNDRLEAPIATAASALHGGSGGGDRDMLHLTVKLTDTLGHFFKGFSLLEDASSLTRIGADRVSIAQSTVNSARNLMGEPMLEITMLLNSTRAQPVRIGETIISYYFHPIVLADRVEVNYMSNIMPEIRAKYSSSLCPIAINDRHQLVRYVECHKVDLAASRK